MAMPMLLSSFALAVASAVVPWISGEIVLLAFVAPATSTPDIALIVIAVTAGQVAGKSVLYWLARRARRLPPPRVAAFLARWRERATRRPAAGMATMLASATFGVPPLYLTTLAAGSLMIEFRAFLPAIICGRLIHFGAIALVPRLVGPLFH